MRLISRRAPRRNHISLRMEPLESRRLLTGAQATYPTLSTDWSGQISDPIVYTADVAPLNGTGTPTGAVTFSIDGVNQPPVALAVVNGVDEAQFTVPTPTLGSHQIGASYGGDGTFAPSTAYPAALDVGGDQIKLTGPSKSLDAGEIAIFTATVTSDHATVTPGGFVVFTVDGINQTPVALSGVNGNDQASFETTGLGAGTHVVSAHYLGDVNDVGAVAAAVQETIGLTHVNVTSSQPDSPIGGPVTFTAIVATTDGVNVPTGNVIFSVDNVAQPPVVLSVVNGVAQATFTTTSLTATPQNYAPHYIQAAYQGDTRDQTSAWALYQTVGVTQTTLTESAQNIAAGQPVTFTALVSLPQGTGGPSGGSVIFTVDNVDQPAVPLVVVNGQSVAVLTTKTLSARAHAISARFTGDSGYLASATYYGALEVFVGETSTAIQSSNTDAPIGQPVTFTATINAVPGSIVPTGTVTFYVDQQSQPPVPVVNVNGTAEATFTTSAIGAGNDHTVYAAYSGDANNVASASEINQAIGAASLKLSASDVNPLAGETETLTAIAATTSGVGTPTGSVIFTIDGADQPPSPLAVVNGVDQATFSTATLGFGSHQVTARYSGDSSYTSSSANSVSLLVGGAFTTYYGLDQPGNARSARHAHGHRHGKSRYVAIRRPADRLGDLHRGRSRSIAGRAAGHEYGPGDAHAHVNGARQSPGERAL